jgi:hypothetical protein
MEEGTILFEHDIGVVAVFDLEHELGNTVSGIRLGKSFLYFTQLSPFGLGNEFKVGKKILMFFLDLSDSFAVDKLIKSAFNFRNNFILLDKISPNNFIQVLDELHSDNLVGKLIVIFIDELRKAQV